MLRYSITTIFCLFAFVLICQSYDDVVLIINSDDESSIEVGEYFSDMRGLEQEQILRYAMSNEEILDTSMAQNIVNQLGLDIQSLRDAGRDVNYIITTKGCPSAVIVPNSNDGLETSFEQVVAFLSIDQTSFLSATFQPGMFDALESEFYLTSRLEAQSVEGTKKLIDLGSSHVINTGRPFAIDYFNSGQNLDPTTDEAIANMINTWVDDNQSELVLSTQNESDVALMDQVLELSGIFFLPFGAHDTMYLNNLSRVDGLAIVINAFGALPSEVTTRDSPLSFLEQNAHAAVGAVDYIYVSTIRRLLDFYATYYNPNLAYNLAEAFYLNNSLVYKPLVLYGDPKSTVEFTSSNGPELEKLSFHIYPNPASNYIFLDLEEEVNYLELDVYNILGQLVESVNRSNLKSLQYSIDHLPVGEYALRIKTEKGNVTSKLIRI